MPLDNGQYELRIATLEHEVSKLIAEIARLREEKQAPYVYPYQPFYVQPVYPYNPYQYPHITWTASGTQV